MSTPKSKERKPYPSDELQWLWNGLAGKWCPHCDGALNNGTGITIEPGGVFRHTVCERPPKAWEGPIRKPKG